MSVKSAKRVIEIFELLSRHQQGLTIKEVSEKLNVPQSSTFNLLKTLSTEGYVRQDMLKKYRLGEKLIPLGTIAMESLDIYSIGLPHLQKLMNTVQETIFMSVLSGDELVYIAKIDTNRSIRTSAQPGSKKPLYCTGLGKAFLAFLPEQKREELLQSMELKPITEKTIVNKEELITQLKQFNKNGYSIDDEESEEGLYCLAAPIFGSDRQIVAAISAAGPKERMLSRKDFITQQLMGSARKISESIGYIEQ
ncbi:MULTISPECIES: IclR family transcriptional regulator [Virgibacillus]|uniref:IclR family transcriptional regulator n=1 Tax=Virgibacillus pantothenticus TaxID=1473 RepID=A0A0L0QJN6_VIRPA|nr:MULTISPECIES: IclR family transcriptional regulator [Virgibacillus]API92985.1 IclR family transcriptional regulator [Virgibacillus sp. 6R]KNE18782.1 IclR family transcriptional regulator [Virgibacillus pantothenticus]MBS7428514.1 IclR family transcriptional regulator [Virgibacillus sp. 19R1-5]MBU8567190.1 IclR family transcriptional regulator [Virgibacillus pantothenticus]MBU8600780.1 IclR family transcriptional regulator [Virgibacillus pantothenticus]